MAIRDSGVYGWILVILVILVMGCECYEKNDLSIKWVQTFVGKIGERLVWGFENDQNMLKQAHKRY